MQLYRTVITKSYNDNSNKENLKSAPDKALR